MLSCLTVFWEEKKYLHVAGCLDLMVFSCLCCPSGHLVDQYHAISCWAGPALPYWWSAVYGNTLRQMFSFHSWGSSCYPLAKPYSSTSWCSLILHSRKMLTDERGRCLQEAGHQAPSSGLRGKGETRGLCQRGRVPRDGSGGAVLV